MVWKSLRLDGSVWNWIEVFELVFGIKLVLDVGKNLYVF